MTITIRESFRNKYRNSNKPAWEKFSQLLKDEGHEVLTFPECEWQPISLEYRMAAYAGAKMNFGVNCGPMALCAMSDAPYMIINMVPRHKPDNGSYDVLKLMVGGGFGPGSQFSFRNKNQELVWEPDDYENIVNAYQRMNGA